jgi:hypothetical protein
MIIGDIIKITVFGLNIAYDDAQENIEFLTELIKEKEENKE